MDDLYTRDGIVGVSQSVVENDRVYLDVITKEKSESDWGVRMTPGEARKVAQGLLDAAGAAEAWTNG